MENIKVVKIEHKGTDADMVRTRLKTLGLNKKIIKEIIKVPNMVEILADCPVSTKTSEGVITFNIEKGIGIRISHKGKVYFHRLKYGATVEDVLASLDSIKESLGI